jgi:hypothetical protein
MAQTTIAQPQSFTPAFNPVKFLIDSTNKNLDGFKYIFDVYDGATQIGRFKVLPRIVDGYGELDLSRFLTSYLSWNFEPNVNTDYDASNCYFSFTLKTGEEYLAEFTYTSSLTNSSGYVRVNVNNTFVVGDQINIVQADGGTANPLVEGLHVVTNSSGTWFEIGVAWSSVTDVAIDGVVTYADNRKLAVYDITTFAKQSYNGVFKWALWPSYDETNYELTANIKLWVTDQPQTGFYATLGQDLWLNAKAKPGKNIVFENSNGDILYKNTVATGSIVGIAVGYERGEVQRDEYNKDVQGYVTGGQWKYETQEFGFNTYQVSATKTLELNTNYMTQEMATYFEQLITSPQVYMKRVTYTCPDGILVTSTEYVPVILVTNSYEVFKQRNKNLIKQTVVVKLSNNDVING